MPGFLSDTWEWDGVGWTLVAAGSSPGMRQSGAFAYDSTRKVVLLFGGDGFGTKNDTLEFDGGWHLRVPTNAPSPRTSAAIAYDTQRQVAVLFGGHNGLAYFDETWEWDGVSWTQRSPVANPGKLIRATMTYDPVRRRMVLYGGVELQGMTLVRRNDVWEWDGTNWTHPQPALSPPVEGAFGPRIVFEPNRQRSVLFISGPFGLDTWEWDGSSWRRRANAKPAGGPSSRHSAAIAYDSARDLFVLFGGQASGQQQSDTWILR